MRVKTSDLTGPALDWAVNVANGGSGETFLKIYTGGGDKRFVQSIVDSPSTNWDQAGAIIDREGIGFYRANQTTWRTHPYGGEYNAEGATAILAAMRCYVLSRMGEEIEIPDVIWQDVYNHKMYNHGVK